MRRLFMVLVVLMLPTEAMALDTSEPYPLGASEYELYYDYFGISRARRDSEMGVSALFGIGITERLSAYLAPAFGGNGNFGPKETQMSAGVFGTVIESRHVDLDIGVAFVNPMAVALDFELNLDVENDLKVAGMYVRGRFAIEGEPEDEEASLYHPTRFLEDAVGFYWTVRDGIQILEENYFNLRVDTIHDIREVSYNGSALGLNVMLHPHVEILLSFYAQRDEGNWIWGAGIGTIMTVDYLTSASRTP